MRDILVINAGSSSVKYQLIDMTDESVIAKGIAERIGIGGSVLTHRAKGKEPFKLKKDMGNHGEAIREIISAITDKEHGVLKDLSTITAVGHRVLHGGDKFCQPAIVNDEILDAIRDNIELGPLHNPANIKGIETCMELMPDIPNVAVFDTAFHQTMPNYAYLYGIPYEVYEKYKVRKYGFHGTSHKYISERIPQILGVPVEQLKIITCHLGNGASIAAIDGGKSVDTSMGLTPLEGLVMGTRAGDIDAAALPYLMHKLGLTGEAVVNFLNNRSGLLGVSGVSSDFRDLKAAAAENNERAKIAIEMFCYRIKKYIGSYAAAMGGVDVIAFAGGIGENAGDIRLRCMKGLEFLGVVMDEDTEMVNGEAIISKPESKIKVMVVPTNEEVMIAREAHRLTKGQS